mmetsp:Transcript_18791/g.52362  ORF Transcript_18791/g.52362 Transcript_18791/m.52362 type:complete len:219 (-) Transcript_18791:260-916(-)
MRAIVAAPTTRATAQPRPPDLSGASPSKRVPSLRAPVLMPSVVLRPRTGATGSTASCSAARAQQSEQGWADNRIGSGGMGKEGASMEEALVWRFWREWGGNKHCRAMINGAPTKPSGGRNYVYRNPQMMEERLLALRRLVCPRDEDMTRDLLEHIMRIPIKEPRILSLSPSEMAMRIVELRFLTRQDVVQLIIFEPQVLMLEGEELAARLKERTVAAT